MKLTANLARNLLLDLMNLQKGYTRIRPFGSQLALLLTEATGFGLVSIKEG